MKSKYYDIQIMGNRIVSHSGWTNSATIYKWVVEDMGCRYYDVPIHVLLF